jgi:putative hemolysin
MKNKLLLLPLGLILIFGIFAFLRFKAPEDSWICQNGEWIKHGNPSFPIPDYPCQVEGQKVLDSANTQIANPAAQNCLDKGGKLEKLEETAGQLGLCRFSDGTVCEEWQFFQGECQKGEYTTADTSHPYQGIISQKGKEYIFKTIGGVEYLLQLPENLAKEIQQRLVSEVKAQETVTIVAAETPPLSKTLILKGFQEK